MSFIMTMQDNISKQINIAHLGSLYNTGYNAIPTGYLWTWYFSDDSRAYRDDLFDTKSNELKMFFNKI